ncbi:hypothetical protein GGTG_09279 [Gaeumannomyces tritici R3-111a-1]|uniref:Uncharacterized protein n=1 Tax=Gaeumannomyces tritici (strain R3-111a-1) TaxID=644352 RepID=J3P6Y3_GAET3|nr:hypothetical protein GGTG_09279 [Gaeumannomyces tritici R3-111a-1]EJT72413.1 hypothetical protein GGTG_09279 [Gaeumannomyces tritici R3-111a-1]
MLHRDRSRLARLLSSNLAQLQARSAAPLGPGLCLCQCFKAQSRGCGSGYRTCKRGVSLRQKAKRVSKIVYNLGNGLRGTGPELWVMESSVRWSDLFSTFHGSWESRSKHNFESSRPPATRKGWVNAISGAMYLITLDWGGE